MVRHQIALGASAALLLFATAACGSDAPSTTAEDGFVVTAVAGCEQGWTDPADLSATRTVARCKPGTPAPQPLKDKAKLTMAITNKQAELIGPLMWAQKHGEFAKEGIDLEIKVVPPADALNLLASNKIDAWLSGPDASFHNALDQDYELRWVTGNYTESPKSKSGLWTRAGNEGDLKGDTVGSAAGPGSVIMYPIGSALEKAGLGITDVKVQTLASADQITAFKNGGIDAAWLLTPVWGEVADDPAFAFVGGQPPAEPLGGFIFGKKLLNDQPAVGRALLRAYIRAINTKFAGEYKADKSLVSELSELLEVPAETIASTPSLIFDWEIRQGTSERAQKFWHELGSLSYKGTIKESEVVDRSFYEAVVGHED